MSPSRPPLSSKKKLLFLAVYCAFLLVFMFAVAEVIVRGRGFKPFHVEPVGISVEPGGHFFTADPVLGYRQLPGTFKITLKDGYTFTATHYTNSLRITHPLATYPIDAKKPQIWIMGCSFTHGWSLNDEDTYPWLVQKALPDYEVLNFGVNGYGTVHSLLQFREALKHGPKPAAVVVAYAEFHDERNTFLRARRKAVVPYNQLGPIAQPYARLAKNGQLIIHQEPAEYAEFPLMRYSAFVHFLEQKYDGIEDHFVRSHQVSEALMRQFAAECKSAGIQFVVAGITADTPPMLAFCKQQGILAVDISVHLSTPGYNNLPHDDHPSALADKIYAEKLTAFLRDSVLKSATK